METLLEKLSDKFHEIMKEKRIMEDKELETEISKSFPEYTLVFKLLFLRMLYMVNYAK